MHRWLNFVCDFKNLKASLKILFEGMLKWTLSKEITQDWKLCLQWEDGRPEVSRTQTWLPLPKTDELLSMPPYLGSGSTTLTASIWIGNIPPTVVVLQRISITFQSYLGYDCDGIIAKGTDSVLRLSATSHRKSTVFFG